MSQIILAIVLDSLLFLGHVVCAAVIFFWRRKKFHKQIHNTGVGCVLYAFSAFFAVMAIIAAHLFAPTIEEAMAYEPDEIVVCRGQYDVTDRRDYHRLDDTDAAIDRIQDLVGYARANGIGLVEIPPGS